MNAHAEISAPSSIQSLLDLLGGISVSETYVSHRGNKKCQHFKAFGIPDDFTKRVITYLSDLNRECDQFMRDFKQKDLHDKVDTIFAGSEEALKAGIDSVQEQQRQFDTGLDTRVRRINYVTNILHEEIIRQFPEADNKAIDHLFVDDDWTVGWLDHTRLGDEIFETLMGNESDLLQGVMALGPDGTPMSIDEALKDFPPEMAEAIKGDLSEIVGKVRTRSPHATPRGGKLAETLAAIAGSIARGRRPLR